MELTVSGVLSSTLCSRSGAKIRSTSIPEQVLHGTFLAVKLEGRSQVTERKKRETGIEPATSSSGTCHFSQTHVSET
jgi:hypothetical protein